MSKFTNNARQRWWTRSGLEAKVIHWGLKTRLGIMLVAVVKDLSGMEYTIQNHLNGCALDSGKPHPMDLHDEEMGTYHLDVQRVSSCSVMVRAYSEAEARDIALGNCTKELMGERVMTRSPWYDDAGTVEEVRKSED